MVVYPVREVAVGRFTATPKLLVAASIGALLLVPTRRPEAVLADTAYTNALIRRELRRRGIKAVIPEKSNQVTAPKRRKIKGGATARL